jgi:transposase-like protein
LEIAVPRDRKGEFEPQIVKKNIHVCQRHDNQRHRRPHPRYLWFRSVR